MGTSQDFNGDQFYLVDETSDQSRITIQPGGGRISFLNGDMFAEGNAGQSPNKSGFVKAMALVKDDNAVVKCYNSQASGSAVNTPPCGINVSFENEGRYLIDFGFPVVHRFFSLTPRCLTDGPSCPTDVTAVIAGTLNDNQLRAYLRSVAGGAKSGFFIIVY